MGVQLFYVISAFTLAHSFGCRKQRERRPVINFFIRRLFRIGPLFWTAIIVYNCFDQVRYFDQLNWTHGVVQWPHILVTAFFLHAWYPTTINSVVPGGWSVGVEMSFYLLFPLLMAILKTMRQAICATVVAVAVTITLNLSMFRIFGSQDGLFNVFLFLWLPCQLPVFLLGIVFYFIFLRNATVSPMIVGNAQSRATLLFVGALTIMGTASFLPNRVIYMSHFIFGVAFMLGAWALLLFSPRALVNTVTCYIGKVSYSCYLVHFLVIYFIFANAMPMFSPAFSGMGSGVQFALVYILGMVVTVAFSTLTYRYIERPGMALGKRLINALES